MAFHFKWESIRHLREQKRQQAQWKYTETLKKLEEVETKLAEFAEKVQQAAGSNQPAADRTVTAQKLQDADQYIALTREAARRYEAERDQLRRQAQIEQKQLKERRISEEILNKLREADFAEYREEEKRKEQLLTDEVAVQHYGRNAGGGVP